MKWTAISAAAGLTLTLGLPAQAQDETPDFSEPPEIDGEVIEEDLGSHQLRLGIGLAETSPQYISAQYFADILDERTEGRIQVEIYPNSQIGDDAQMMEMLQTGSLDMTYPSTSPATAYVEELAVFDLPFLVPTREAARAVMESEPAQQMLDDFEGSGIKALTYSENGFRQLTNSVGPVSSPEDLEGMSGFTVRTMENVVQLSIWEALGANPTPMAFGEVFSALEQGVIDAQENPWSTILTSNFYEVQDYATETRHVYTPFILMMSEQTWNELDPAYQELVQEAADKSADYEIQIAAEYDDWSRKKLEERGMEIIRLSDEQRAEFEEAVQPVYDEWAPQIGEDLVADIREVVAETRED